MRFKKLLILHIVWVLMLRKAIKGLGKNLKIANTFHFKGGVKGMAEMAVYAEKMKVDMGSIAWYGW